MTKEQEIAHLMKSLDLTREEAEQLWQDDHDDYESDEMKQMAANAKKNGLLKTGAREIVDPAGKKQKRERKPNEAKRAIIKDIYECALTLKENAEIVNPEKQIDFWQDGIHYSVTLTAHRPPKGKA